MHRHYNRFTGDRLGHVCLFRYALLDLLCLCTLHILLKLIVMYITMWIQKLFLQNQSSNMCSFDENWDEIIGKQCVTVHSPVSYSQCTKVLKNEYSIIIIIIMRSNTCGLHLWFTPVVCNNCVMLKIGTRDAEISYTRNYCHAVCIKVHVWWSDCCATEYHVYTHQNAVHGTYIIWKELMVECGAAQAIRL